jgi:hypothetical protein
MLALGKWDGEKKIAIIEINMYIQDISLTIIPTIPTKIIVFWS